MKSLIVALALAGTSLGQQPCSIKITGGFDSYRGPHYTALQFQNTSNKVITAVKFRLFAVDAVGDRKELVETSAETMKLKPNKKHTVSMQGILHDKESNRPIAWDDVHIAFVPDKVVYEDGTIIDCPRQ